MPVINNLYFKFRSLFARYFPNAYSFCDTHKSVVKFFISGSFAGGSDLVFLYFFYGILGWGIVISTSVAFILSFVVSFTLQKFWTFRNYEQNQMASQLVLYLINAFIGLNLNGWLMHFLVNRFGVWYILAQIIVNLSIGFYNFLIYKFIIFKTDKNENNGQQKTIEGSARDVA